MRRATVLILALTCGCVSKQKVERELSLCPDYFRQNIGKAFVMPISIEGIMGLYGRVDTKDPEHPFYIYGPFANADTVLHEAFHSFEYRAGHQRKDEWQAFYDDFHNGKTWYFGVPGLFACMFVPFLGDMPLPGHVRFYSALHRLEDTADCFAFWMRGKKRNDKELNRKCEIVGKFAQGYYRQPSGR